MTASRYDCWVESLVEVMSSADADADADVPVAAATMSSRGTTAAISEVLVRATVAAAIHPPLALHPGGIPFETSAAAAASLPVTAVLFDMDSEAKNSQLLKDLAERGKTRGSAIQQGGQGRSGR